MDLLLKDQEINFPNECNQQFWSRYYKLIEKHIQKSFESSIVFNFNDVKVIDSTTVASVEQLQEFALSLHKTVRLEGLSQDLKHSFETFSFKRRIESGTEEVAGFFEKIGGSVLAARDQVVEFFYLVSETLYWSIKDLTNSRGRLRGSVVAAGVHIGVNALPIIALLSFLIGLVLGLQSAAQLRQFGANIFIVHLIGISMTREMGPLMTAIILAGRSGSAFASEIATMKVSEELDALQLMALNPVRFVVVPKFYGITMSAPLLTILADVLGIMGGFVIAVLYLDLTPYTFFSEMVQILIIKDIITSMVKSVVFAWIIVLIGSHYGFQASGGPEGVGRVTTQSVVAAIFGVIVADSILGLLFYF